MMQKQGQIVKMKMSHNRTPSDPGPPKAVSHKEGKCTSSYLAINSVSN